MERPEKTEYAEYYERYISLVEETDIVAALERQQFELLEIFKEIDEEKSFYSYAEGKWTIKELLGHITDTERIFAYRALRIARGDETPIEGFEEDDYAENSNAYNTKLPDLISEFLYTRKANVIFFQNLTNRAWLRTGTASDATVSVRALAFMLVGHVRHHLNILRERYLNEV